MKTILIALLCTVGITLQAQPVDSRGMYADKKAIENTDMGWMYPLKLSQATAFSKNGWTYTARQTDAAHKLTTWVRETYRTIGLLGDVKPVLLLNEASKYRGTKDYSYNDIEKDAIFGLPNSYGAKAQFHFCVSKTKERKFWPTPGNWCNVDLHIMANNIGLIAEQVVALNSPNDYYFLMPRYTIGEKGRNDKEWMPGYANYRNFTNSPNLAKYEHYFFPKEKNLAYIIIMTKDGKPLPIEQVTVGEFIKQLEKQMPQMLQIAQNRSLIYENYQENAKKGIQVLKNLLGSQLKNYVYTYDNFLQLDIIDMANIGSSGKLPTWLKTQPLSPEGYKHVPLWRLKEGVKKALATAGPEWIVCRLEQPIGYDYPGSIRLMDDFVSRFNYEYVYNYFFGKDTVQNPYKPVVFAD